MTSTAAVVYARLDANARELTALRRENQRVCAERDTAKALATTGGTR
ncbi:hypothetical protein [Mycobacterium paragordonae]|nr:hypothetical protein [Mycobacterium paragordonae]